MIIREHKRYLSQAQLHILESIDLLDFVIEDLENSADPEDIELWSSIMTVKDSLKSASRRLNKASKRKGVLKCHS